MSLLSLGFRISLLSEPQEKHKVAKVKRNSDNAVSVGVTALLPLQLSVNAVEINRKSNKHLH